MISLILLIIAAIIIDTAMDMDMNDFPQSIFTKYNPNFWNPTICYKNKWKDGISGGTPKFFGSTTFLVFLTDGWHLLKSAFLTTIVLSIILYKPIALPFIPAKYERFEPVLFFFGFKIVWGLVFQLFEKIFSLKTK